MLPVLAFRLTVASGDADILSGPVVPKNLLAAPSAAPTRGIKGRQIAALLGVGLAAYRLRPRLGMGMKDVLSGPCPLHIFVPRVTPIGDVHLVSVELGIGVRRPHNAATSVEVLMFRKGPVRLGDTSGLGYRLLAFTRTRLITGAAETLACRLKPFARAVCGVAPAPLGGKQPERKDIPNAAFLRVGVSNVLAAVRRTTDNVAHSVPLSVFGVHGKGCVVAAPERVRLAAPSRLLLAPDEIVVGPPQTSESLFLGTVRRLAGLVLRRLCIGRLVLCGTCLTVPRLIRDTPVAGAVIGRSGDTRLQRFYKPSYDV